MCSMKLLPLHMRQTILCNVSNPLCCLKRRSATLTSFAKQFVFISQQPIISAFEDRMTIPCVTRKTPVLKEKLPIYVRHLIPSKIQFDKITYLILFWVHCTLNRTFLADFFIWFWFNLLWWFGFSETIWPWNELNCFLILTLTQCSPSSLSLYLFLSVPFPLLDSLYVVFSLFFIYSLSLSLSIELQGKYVFPRQGSLRFFSLVTLHGPLTRPQLEKDPNTDSSVAIDLTPT